MSSDEEKRGVLRKPRSRNDSVVQDRKVSEQKAAAYHVINRTGHSIIHNRAGAL